MYGISGRTAERYLRAARKQIIARSGKSREEHFADALNFYESIISGPDATLRERMEAQHQLCVLLGLYAPRRLRHGGDRETPPLKTECEGPLLNWSRATLEDLQTMRAIRARLEVQEVVVNGREEVGQALAELRDEGKG
jgi:hypothetical protein